MTKKSTVFLLLLICLGISHPTWAAERNVQAKIQTIEVERQQLAAARKHLESQLGQLGKQVKHLDVALKMARDSAKQAANAVRQTDARLAQLTHQQRMLKKQVVQLQRKIIAETGAAWQQGGHEPSWFTLLQGSSMAALPHRQYIMHYLLQAQVEDRRAFVQKMTHLHKVSQALRQARINLYQLQKNEEVTQRQLALRRKNKRDLWRRVRHDAHLKKTRDKELARQEKALRALLTRMNSRLLATDKTVRWVSVRKLKGRLPWPIHGKITARFGSRPNPGRPKLAGVQIAPTGHNKQVKSIAPGQVRYADWFGSYGLMLIVDHGEGLMSVYAHNDVLYKQLGDWVDAGDTLADAGNTGWVEHTRLYFEIRNRSRASNPVRWCRRRR